MKDEPHKESKIAEKRYRLIACLSLEEQCVDRWLFMDWVTTQLDNCMKIPSKTGWSPLPNGFRDYLLEMAGYGLATDCSAFDWTWKDWMVEQVLECKLAQCRSSPEHLAIYRRVVLLRFSQILGPHCEVALPNGEVYRQTFWGFMKSGWYLTISLNGDCQVACNALAWIRYWRKLGLMAPPFPPIWVMGDDVRVRIPRDFNIPEYVEQLTTTGLRIKEWSCREEFAGFAFGGSLGRPTVEPLYPAKHKFILAHTGPDQIRDSLVQMSMLYSLSESDWLHGLTSEYVPYSPEVFRAWALGLPCARIKPTRSLWTWEA